MSASKLKWFHPGPNARLAAPMSNRSDVAEVVARPCRRLSDASDS